ncbi:MAG: class I SAM-dependent methyltransferase [Methylococcaceae bacterium]|nr:class I SAM-dependent methyltransferase [Methylococcaceae bacterium]
MPRLSMLPTLVREVFGTRDFPREPEPALVMEDKEQVAAYAEAGRIDGVMSAAYLFQTSRIIPTIYGKKKILDLGCGPATQLAQLAEFLPDTSFTGIDLSEEMISDAKQYVSKKNLQNVDFILGDITKLQMLDAQSFDGVISTMALHHLPSYDDLHRCFEEIKRVLKPGGVLYLTDFGRLKSLQSVLFFAYQNKAYQPHSFSLDYERSLRAAFLPSEFNKLLGVFSGNVKAYSTFGIPILVILKTPDIEIPKALISQLREEKRKLPTKYQRELNDIRLFFGLSGLKNDLF